MTHASASPAITRVGWHVAATVAISLIVGCGTESPPAPLDTNRGVPAPKTLEPEDSSTSSPNSSDDAAKDAATTAYFGMWEDFTAAAETSDWQSPELARHAADEALSVLSRGLYADHYNGLVTTGELILDPAVSSVDPPKNPTTVVIADCADTSDWLVYDSETGVPVDDQSGGLRAITAVVEEQGDGSWKVTGFAVGEVGSCG
jgi:hypothetical protein